MFEPSKELLALKAFFETVPNGSYVSYSDIESATSIKMNIRGKSLMRSALRSLKREYRCDKGDGIQLESADIAMNLVTGRVNRASNSLKRANKTTQRMTERYVEALPKPDRDRLIATASLFGTMMAMAKGLSKIYKPAAPALNTVSAPKLPDYVK